VYSEHHPLVIVESRTMPTILYSQT